MTRASVARPPGLIRVWRGPASCPALPAADRNRRPWRLNAPGAALALVLIWFAGTAPCRAEPLLVLATHLAPIAEVDDGGRQALVGFAGEVHIQSHSDVEVLLRLQADDLGRPGLVVGSYGELLALDRAGLLDDLDDVAAQLGDRFAVPYHGRIGRLAGTAKRYVPWAQATYLMVAHRRALGHLPEGAELASLTYDELAAWAANMAEASGRPRLAFPAGPNGLIHRFVQGYLYPSFTGAMVGGFRSPEAAAMWQSFVELWRYVDPRSIGYDAMHEALSSGEVWVAWDHMARLMPAVEDRPDDFVLFPAPAGPKGRGVMIELAGLAVPLDAPDRARSAALVEFMLRPGTQMRMLDQTVFLPVADTADAAEAGGARAMLRAALAAQMQSDDVIFVMAPPAVGEIGAAIDSTYLATFSRIVLAGRDIEWVLDHRARRLNAVLADADLSCWPPDAPRYGPCRTE